MIYDISSKFQFDKVKWIMLYEISPSFAVASQNSNKFSLFGQAQ